MGSNNRGEECPAPRSLSAPYQCFQCFHTSHKVKCPPYTLQQWFPINKEFACQLFEISKLNTLFLFLVLAQATEMVQSMRTTKPNIEISHLTDEELVEYESKLEASCSVQRVN